MFNFGIISIVCAFFLGLSSTVFAADSNTIEKIKAEQFFKDFQIECEKIAVQGNPELADRLLNMAMVCGAIDWRGFEPQVIDKAPASLSESFFSPLHHVFDGMFRSARAFENDRIKPALWATLGYECSSIYLDPIHNFLDGMVEYYDLEEVSLKQVSLCFCAARCLKRWSIVKGTITAFQPAESALQSEHGLCVDFVTLAQDFLQHLKIKTRRGIVTSALDALEHFRNFTAMGSLFLLSLRTGSVSQYSTCVMALTSTASFVMLATGKHHFVIFNIDDEEYVSEVLVPFGNWKPKGEDPVTMKIYKTNQ